MREPKESDRAEVIQVGVVSVRINHGEKKIIGHVGAELPKDDIDYLKLVQQVLDVIDPLDAAGYDWWGFPAGACDRVEDREVWKEAGVKWRPL